MRKPREQLTADDLAMHDAQALADAYQIPIAWTDHQVTRRQRLHGANLPGRPHAFTSTHINEVLQHLAMEGYQQAIFVCETPRRTHLACHIEFSPLRESN